MLIDTDLYITIPSTSSWAAPPVDVGNILLKCTTGCRKNAEEWESENCPVGSDTPIYTDYTLLACSE